MKRLLTLLLGAAAIFGLASPGSSEEYYFRFLVKQRSELSKLTNVVSIDNVRGDTVFAYANDEELAQVLALGYQPVMLAHPSTLYPAKMTSDPRLVLEWDYYPTYPAYVSMMTTFASASPGLCQLYNIGTTVQGRQLLVVKLSDNVTQEEDEPEVFYTSTMHGDEVVGYILLLRLIDHLLANYGVDPQVTALLDNTEIWINPLANPDGTYYAGDTTLSGARRYNANSVDLNRNFPDPIQGSHPDGRDWQPETIAMMNFASANSIVLSANFHGGAEVVNYPWDCMSRLHPDNNWFVQISRQYADSAQFYSPPGYMDDLNNGITNGYDWYEVHGGRQDYMTYFKGGRETTIELSSVKKPSASQLPSFWEYNRRSLLTYVKNSWYGVRGVVTDAVTGQPVTATVWVLNHDADSSRVFTDPQRGDYHRMLSPGTYTLYFTAAGYFPDTVSGVVVSSGQVTVLNRQLQPLPNAPILTLYSHTLGSVHAGDSIAFRVILVNNGPVGANDVSASLFARDTLVTVIEDSVAFPVIGANGGRGLSLSSYLLAVSPVCPEPRLVTLVLGITAAGGYQTADSFVVTVGRDIEGFESANFASFPWQMGGAAPWVIVQDSVYWGVYGARSGSIGHNASSEMSVTLDVATADSIRFYCRVSSEANYDSLKFYIDNVLKGGWSGSLGWRKVSYPIGAGTHTFRWVYAKDGSISRGSDCAWVDHIEFPYLARPLAIVTSSLPDWTAGVAYWQQLQASGGIGTLVWSDQYGNLAGTGLVLASSGVLSGIPLYADTIVFTARVQDQLGRSASRVLSLVINPALVISTYNLPNAVAGISYSYSLQAAGGTGQINWVDLYSELAGTGFTLSSAGVLSGVAAVIDTISFTARATDQVGASSDRRFDLVVTGDFLPGDANGDGQVRGSDVTYLVSYFKGTISPPNPYLAGDANGDCVVSGADVTYLVRYFKGFGESPRRGDCR